MIKPMSKKNRDRLTKALKALEDAIERYLDDAPKKDYSTEILVPIPQSKPTSRSDAKRAVTAWRVKAAVIRVQQAYWKALRGGYRQRQDRLARKRVENVEGGPLPMGGWEYWNGLLAECRAGERKGRRVNGREVYFQAIELHRWAKLERVTFERGEVSADTRGSMCK